MWKEKERQKNAGLIAIYRCDFQHVCFLDQLPYTRWKTMHFKNYVHRLSFLVAWWRHEMETLSHYWPFVLGIYRSPVNSHHKGQWRGALMFSLICAWIKGWSNNGEARDSRRHRAHYDVTVMYLLWLSIDQFIHIPFTTHPLLRLYQPLAHWGRVIPVWLNQYRGCWCPFSLRRQVIDSHDIDYGN